MRIRFDQRAIGRNQSSNIAVRFSCGGSCSDRRVQGSTDRKIFDRNASAPCRSQTIPVAMRRQCDRSRCGEYSEYCLIRPRILVCNALAPRPKIQSCHADWQRHHMPKSCRRNWLQNGAKSLITDSADHCDRQHCLANEKALAPGQM